MTTDTKETEMTTDTKTESRNLNKDITYGFGKKFYEYMLDTKPALTVPNELESDLFDCLFEAYYEQYHFNDGMLEVGFYKAVISMARWLYWNFYGEVVSIEVKSNRESFKSSWRKIIAKALGRNKKNDKYVDGYKLCEKGKLILNRALYNDISKQRTEDYNGDGSRHKSIITRLHNIQEYYEQLLAQAPAQVAQAPVKLSMPAPMVDKNPVRQVIRTRLNGMSQKEIDRELEKVPTEKLFDLL